MSQPEMINRPATIPEFSIERLPDSTRVGNRARIFAHEVSFGEGVVLGENVTLVGDSIALGDGTKLGNEVDVRASRLQIGKRCEIQHHTQVCVAETFRLGDASRICAHGEITCRHFEAGEFFFLGHASSVGYGGTYESTSRVMIGDNVALGPHNILNANCQITLRDRVGSGAYVTFWTHGFHFGHSVLDGYTATFKPIEVDENVWLGYHVTLLPGCSLGENTIVASGSVVTKPMPSNFLIGGVPAKRIKPLAQADHSDSQNIKIVEGVLRKWLVELEYKGWGYKELNGDLPLTLTLQEYATGQRCELLLTCSKTQEIPRFREITQIILAIEPRESWVKTLNERQCLFELRSGRYSGFSSELTQDLRDYLRRHTLICGNDELLAAILPLDFQRLKDI